MCMRVYDFIAASGAPEIRTRETLKLENLNKETTTLTRALRIVLLKNNQISGPIVYIAFYRAIEIA